VSDLRLYWARNDGMTGHVFLAEQELAALEQEMVLQGMDLPGLKPGIQVSFTEVDAALATASPDPISIEPKLWNDWLRFLEGASTNGGLLVR
jgi:hypothetical protein